MAKTAAMSPNDPKRTRAAQKKTPVGARPVSDLTPGVAMINAKVYLAATAMLLMGAAEAAAQTTFECKAPPKSKVVASSIGETK